MTPYSAILFLVIAASAACSPNIKTGAIIDQYNRAECIPVGFGPGIIPPTRAWDYMLKTRKGLTVQISGADLPGGRIVVKYTSNGKTDVAADAGDYIYPADVRFDRISECLYIKASGLAVTDGTQTWLYEYDLNKQKQTGRARVDPSVLQRECPVNNSN